MTGKPSPSSLILLTYVLVDGCRIAFMEDLNFWDIDEMLLETCCHQVDTHDDNDNLDHVICGT